MRILIFQSWKIMAGKFRLGPMENFCSYLLNRGSDSHLTHMKLNNSRKKYFKDLFGSIVSAHAPISGDIRALRGKNANVGQ
jgi:hypothetical protein